MTINDWLYSGPTLVAAGCVEIEIDAEPVPDTGSVEWGFTSGSGWGNNRGVLPPVVRAHLAAAWYRTPEEAKAAINVAAIAWARAGTTLLESSGGPRPRELSSSTSTTPTASRWARSGSPMGSGCSTESPTPWSRRSGASKSRGSLRPEPWGLTHEEGQVHLHAPSRPGPAVRPETGRPARAPRGGGVRPRAAAVASNCGPQSRRRSQPRRVTAVASSTTPRSSSSR